jgi:DNA polymerase III delta subunit
MALLIKKEADFRREIKGTPATGYLLFGEEDYLKGICVTLAQQTICPDEGLRPFNEVVLDALDTTPERLLDALAAMPMMADRKLVVLRGLNFGGMRASEVEAWCAVLERLADYDYNTLILPLASGTIDEGRLPKAPSALLSRLGALLTPVQFERCTPAKLNGWCGRHFAHNGVEATPALCARVIEKCGTGMYTLAAEIDKISYYTLAHGRTVLQAEDIDAAACTTVEYDAYAFTNALMDRNLAAALDILSDMKLRRVDPTMLLAEVVRLHCELLAVRRMSAEGRTTVEMARALGDRVPEYRVVLCQKSVAGRSESELLRAVELCNEADAALKRSPQGYVALERLLCGV